MERCYVIINADDLGMSDRVNETVFELMNRRRLTSASVLANGPAAVSAALTLRRFPQCSFGAHLNLTQFDPVVGGAGARLLVDPETGTMSRRIESATRATPGLLRAAFEELCAQIERLAALGVAVSHLDSHNHVHTRPQFFPVLKAVQRRYGLRKVRIAKNLYAPAQPCPPALALRKRLFNSALRTIYRTTTCDVFTELLTFASLMSSGSTGDFRTAELMAHPGAPYAAPEEDLLGSEWLEALAARMELIDYARLGSQ